MKSFLLFLVLIVLFAVIAWFAGPKPSYEDIDSTITTEVTVAKTGDGIEPEWTILYLPSAGESNKEADAFMEKLSLHFAMNLILPVLAEESPKQIIDAVKKRIAEARKMGAKVMLVCSSTAAVPALYLASNNPDLIDALVLYAPILGSNDFFSEDLLKPWAKQRASLFSSDSNEYGHYQTDMVSIETRQAYAYLLNETMNDETFEAITQPLFVTYYFKDEQNKDKNISIKHIDNLIEKCATSSNQKRVIKLERVDSHILTNRAVNKRWQKVFLETQYFIEEVLKVKGIQ